MSYGEAPKGPAVIAIGASAGGLEACRALLGDLPATSRAAFILNLHLDPSHDSMLVDLLAQHTRLRVVEASGGMALQPGFVHVIPPGMVLTVGRGVLHLAEPRGGLAARLPFDVLLRSLAADKAAPMACIVLSGTGTDGSLGLADFAAAGGLVIAQNPAEARFAGMPQSAIRTGRVARTLRTGQMVAALAGLLDAALPAPPRAGKTAAQDPAGAAGSIHDDLLSLAGEQPSDPHFAIDKRAAAATASDPSPTRPGALADLCRRIVTDTYAPAAVLINSRLEALHLLGPTEKYLKIARGHPEAGILDMLPERLRARFRAAAGSCTAANPRVTIPGGRIDGSISYDIALHAVAAGSETLLLACFVDRPRTAAQSGGTEKAGGRDRRTGDREADLEAARSDLSDALRDLARAVEAHGADAAAALSLKEKIRSTTKELLASKEKLRSLNEELTVLNRQLQETLERHRTTANDLQDVLFSTDVATLFLDAEMNIRFFTPAARAVFHVIPTDVGRPLAGLAAVSKEPDLIAAARKVLASGAPDEQETAGADGAWFQRRIQPCRGEGGRIEGVVVTYADITDHKRDSAALSAALRESGRASRAKSRCLASAGHDLRHPLQSMALLHKLLAPQRRSSRGARLFEAEGWMVAIHGSAEDVLAAPRPGGNAVLLVDHLLPGMVGVDLITLLRSEGSRLPAIILTGHGDAATAVAALEAGASDLIEKPASDAEPLTGIRKTPKGADAVPPPSGARKAAQQRFADLTARERAVLERVLAGQPNKIIAHDLGINQRTVENHRASVMRKTGAASLPALVRLSLAADAPGG
ncbi:MAG: chemotaxis protein CheB [Gemmobacter sp.]